MEQTNQMHPAKVYDLSPCFFSQDHPTCSLFYFCLIRRVLLMTLYQVADFSERTNSKKVKVPSSELSLPKTHGHPWQCTSRSVARISLAAMPPLHSQQRSCVSTHPGDRTRMIVGWWGQFSKFCMVRHLHIPKIWDSKIQHWSLSMGKPNGLDPFFQEPPYGSIWDLDLLYGQGMP